MNYSDKNIKPPTSDTPSGKYNCLQIVELENTNKEGNIFYSINGDKPDMQYYGAIPISKNCTLKTMIVVGSRASEEIEFNYIIERKEEKKGTAVVIGGAEHCKEMHQKIVDCVGGAEKAKIAFIPTSSKSPYSSGMDRVVRFRELANLEIDENKIPLLNGKKNFSSKQNYSRFWIVPIAVIDDKNTKYDPVDDLDSPLTNEKEYPDIDESTWKDNGFSKEVAMKLRDEEYNIIFLTGGNQARYLKCLLYPDGTETPVLAVIRDIFENKGGVVAGTSAGAAALSQTMILGGGSYGAMVEGVVEEDVNLKNYDDNYTPFINDSDGRVWLGRGLGFLPPNFLTGTHFITRGRTGRLITACMYLKDKLKHPVIGLGAGEDTAFFVYSDKSVEIVGAVGTLIIDTTKASLKCSEVVKGKFCAKDLIIHYLENGDKFKLNEDGSTEIIEISKTKHKIKSEEITLDDCEFEADIFGRNTLKNFVFENLVNNRAEDCIGFELMDNLEDSYDSILYNDLIKKGSVLLRFTQTEKTSGYKGVNTYNWWGYNDRDYPKLREETERDAFSYHNINTEIIPLQVYNFPDLSDAQHIPLKEDYLRRGKTEEEWLDLFYRYKTYYFGMLVIPLGKGKIEARAFFFDYAYHDDDRNGIYSPPRFRPVESRYRYKDVDIVEVGRAHDTSIIVNGKVMGITDQFGRLIFETDEKKVNIKALYEGIRDDYTVELVDVELPLKEAKLKFTENSYR